MGLAATYANVYFPRVQDIFDESGNMKTEYVEHYERCLRDAYYELLFLARALRWGRLHEHEMQL